MSLINNFLPDWADSFTLMEFASHLGTFANAANSSRVKTANNLASFQVTYTGTNLVASASQSPDTDGDGMTDYDEYLAGTDWLNTNSVLRMMSLTRNVSGQMVLQFSCVTNRSYVIEYTSNLVSRVWTAVPSPVLTLPAPGRCQWIDDGTRTGGLNGSLRAYRVRVEPTVVLP